MNVLDAYLFTCVRAQRGPNRKALCSASQDIAERAATFENQEVGVVVFWDISHAAIARA